MEANKQNNVTQPVAPNTAPAATGGGTPGIAVAALILGILALLTGWIYVGGLLGIAAIVLGIISLKKPGGKGMGLAGIILGVLGLLGAILMVILTIIGVGLFGKAANDISKNINEYQEEQRVEYEQATAKRDFAKGETARFGDLEVKIDKVTRNFVPENEFQRAEAGKELVVLDLTVKNVGEDSNYVSSFSFKLEEAGKLLSGKISGTPGQVLDSASLTPGGSMSGQVMFEVTAGAQDLKLALEDHVYNPSSFRSEEIKYTLAF